MLKVVMLNVIMLNVIMLNVIMLSVIMLSVMAPWAKLPALPTNIRPGSPGTYTLAYYASSSLTNKAEVGLLNI